MLKCKKILTMLCAVTLLIVSTISPACAIDSGIAPYMEHITNGQCILTVKDSTASVTAWLQGHPDVTKTEVTVELQEQYLFFFWSTIDTWSNSSNSIYCRASGSTSVTSGKTYRAVATVTAWAGSDSETQTLTTETMVAD